MNLPLGKDLLIMVNGFGKLKNKNMTTEQIIEQKLADFKAQLLKELTPKQEFEKFIDGGWIFYTVSSPILYRITIKGKDVYAQGIEMSEPKHWCSDIFNTLNCRPATESEIFDALKKEAERRGFKEGVKGIPIYKPEASQDVCKKGWHYDSENDVLFAALEGNGGLPVYHAGKWAEIIKDQPIKIGGYEVKRDGNDYKIGCKTFQKQNLEYIKKLMVYKSFKTIRFDDHEPVSLKTINQILDKLK